MMAKTGPDPERARRFVETEEDAGMVVRDPSGKIVWPPELVGLEEGKTEDLEQPGGTANESLEAPD